MTPYKASLVLVGLLFHFALLAQSSADIPQVVMKQLQSVVTIFINDSHGNQVASASGFIVDASGLVATNSHVFQDLHDGDRTIIVKSETGGLYLASALIADDKENDLAILRVSGKNLPAVKLAVAYKPRQGESIIVIGSPLGLETTVTDGIISNIRGKDRLLQMTAPISPGSSGSPVFNSKGEVIGIATFQIAGGQNLNFAIPVNLLADLMLRGQKAPTGKVSVPVAGQTVSQCPKADTTDDLPHAQEEASRCPNSAKALFALGRAYSDRKMHKEAIAAFGEAIRLKPDYAKAYRFLGHAHNSLSNLREALQAFNDAVKLEPNNALAHEDLGYAYSAMGRTAEAIEEYKLARRLDPKDASYIFSLGRGFAEMGMYKEVLSEYGDFLKLRPDDVSALSEFGRVQSLLQRYHEASLTYEQVTRLQPKNAQARFALAMAYYLDGRKLSAEKELEILKKLSPRLATEFQSMTK